MSFARLLLGALFLGGCAATEPVGIRAGVEVFRRSGTRTAGGYAPSPDLTGVMITC
jgi:hypothetical protein